MINRILQLSALILAGCGHHDASPVHRYPEDAPDGHVIREPVPMNAPTPLLIQKIEPGSPPPSMVIVPGKQKYYIDRTEVTTEDYRECVAANVCPPPRAQKWKTWRAKRPVTLVKPQEAWDYCVYRGKRLPTRDEWIRAAVGDDGRKFPWGNAAPSCELAVVRGCAKEIADAGSKPKGASPYGALDLAGNVWEFANLDTSGDRARFDPVALGGDGWTAPNKLGKYFEPNPFTDSATYDETTGFRCALTPPP